MKLGSAMGGKRDVTLRVLGTADTLIEPMRQRAVQDLGFDIRYEPLDGLALQQRAALHPESFDILDHWSTSAELLWTSRSIQGIDVGRLGCWPALGPYLESGALVDDPAAEGRSPMAFLFIQEDGGQGRAATDRLSMLPTVHNVDSFGYLPALRADLNEKDRESWAWLLDARWRGKIGLTAHAGLGAIEAALTARAAGQLEIADTGNLSVGEIDALVDLLIERKQDGWFATFWNSPEESVSVAMRDKVLIESIWSASIARLRAERVPIINASPVEGYRGWMDGLCLSAAAEGAALDAAYAYLDWWMSGWPGAQMASLGYYVPLPAHARAHLSAAEWDYWYGGQTAEHELYDPFGKVVVQRGQRRDGGSYRDRMGNNAVWNSFMDEHNYLVRRWHELLSA